jgi:hypothetical protein
MRKRLLCFHCATERDSKTGLYKVSARFSTEPTPSVKEGVAPGGDMFDKYPCFRFKRRKPNGDSYELEVRASLLRWIIVGLAVVALLLCGIDPMQIITQLVPKL